MATSSFCPTACTTITLTSLPTGDCPKLGFRERTLSRIWFKSCATDLPALPYTNANLAPLIASGDIAFSMPLANASFADPEVQQQLLADCLPPIDILTRRVFSFEDRYSVQIVTGGVVTDKFYDYKFWQAVIDNKTLLNVGFEYCDGDVYWAKDVNGNFLQASINAFISYVSNGEGNGSIEIKKGTISFKGDPLSFTEPDFNAVELELH